MAARRLVKSREHTLKGVIVALAETMFEVMVGARYNIISCESAFAAVNQRSQVRKFPRRYHRVTDLLT